MSQTAMEHERKCPQCRWGCVRFATRRKRRDYILQLVFLRPFRCRSCRHRFYRFRLPEDTAARLVTAVLTLLNKLEAIAHRIPTRSTPPRYPV